MARILLEAFKGLIGKPANLGRQIPVRDPEFRRSVMGQSGVVLPAA